MNTPQHSLGHPDPLAGYSFDSGNPYTTAAPKPPMEEAADEALAAEVDVRQQAVTRARKLGANLAFHCWEQRYSEPLCPHTVAYLFLQPDRQRPRRWLLSAAWQLWFDLPDVRDLPRLLMDLHHRLAPQASAGFDVREQVCVGRDENMAGDARYFGLAVVSLDTVPSLDNLTDQQDAQPRHDIHDAAPPLRWEQIRESATGVLDIGSLGRIVLADGSVILADQKGRPGFNEFTVRSSHTMAHLLARPLFDWKRVPVERIRTHAEHAMVLRWATELHDTVSQADNARLWGASQAYRTSAPGRGGGQP